MRFRGYLYKNVHLLNVVLLAAIVATIVFAVMPLLHTKVRFALPVIKAKTVGKQEAVQEKSQALSPLDYVMIGEDNLFHPERRILEDMKEEKQLPKPELVLYGTVIHEGMSVAYVEDKKSPKTTPGRGERQQVVKKGAVFNGFVLKEIETDRIVLARGEEMMVVNLLDETKRKGAEAGKGAPKPPAAKGAPRSRPPTPARAAPSRTPASVRTPPPNRAPVGPGDIEHAPPGQPFSRKSRGQAPLAK